MKKIISTTYDKINELNNIIIPDYQRIIDPLKVQEIVDWQKDFFNKNNYYCYTGTIILIQYEDNHYLIDGQHRYASLENLSKEQIYPEVDYQIWKVSSTEAIREIYYHHNKNTPLPDIDFEEKNKSLIEKICNYYRNKYPKAWKQENGKRTNRPFLNFNKFQEACAFLCHQLNWTNVEEVVQNIDLYNSILAGRNVQAYPKITSTMYEKAKSWGLYLGLFNYESNKEYIFGWVKEIITFHAGEKKTTEYKNINTARKCIPKSLRNKTWNQYIGDNIAKAYCICCNDKMISMQEFECGHIISDADGGEISIDNLLPICSCCNKSMGKKNMREFIFENFPENIGNFDKRLYIQNKNNWSFFG